MIKQLTTALTTLSIFGSLAQGAEENNTIATNHGDWLSKDRFGLGVSASSLGFGGHLTYDINNKLYLKGELQGLGLTSDLDIDGVNYEGDLDFLSGGLSLQYLPFADKAYGKGFRLSVGAYGVDNKAKITASSPGEVINIGGAAPYTLTTGDTLNGDIAYSTFAPYLGIGWDWSWGEEKQYTVSLDTGILFVGTPDVELAPNAGSALSAAIPLSEFDNEIQDLKDDLDSFQYYPVVRLGFTWRF